jgi:hypothetical protein
LTFQFFYKCLNLQDIYLLGRIKVCKLPVNGGQNFMTVNYIDLCRYSNSVKKFDSPFMYIFAKIACIISVFGQFSLFLVAFGVI